MFLNHCEHISHNNRVVPNEDALPAIMLEELRHRPRSGRALDVSEGSKLKTMYWRTDSDFQIHGKFYTNQRSFRSSFIHGWKDLVRALFWRRPDYVSNVSSQEFHKKKRSSQELYVSSNFGQECSICLEASWSLIFNASNGSSFEDVWRDLCLF
jgi:hypothetical protein